MAFKYFLKKNHSDSIVLVAILIAILPLCNDDPQLPGLEQSPSFQAVLLQALMTLAFVGKRNVCIFRNTYKNFTMNTFLKNFGIILIILGVVVLGFYAMNTPTSNTPLIFAALLLIGGTAIHIILNRLIE